METNVNVASSNGRTMANGIGLLAGLAFAYHRGSGFWGYVGWGILGSVVATTAYTVIVPSSLVITQTAKTA